MSGIFKSRRMAVLLAAVMVFTLALGATAALAKGKPAPALAGATGTVTIKVVGYYGQAPLAGVKVGFYNDTTNYRGSGTTDANGLVTFTGVPLSNVNCWASLSLNGYRDSNRTIILTGTDTFSQQIMYPLSSF